MRFSMKALLFAVTFVGVSCGGLLYANAFLATCFTTAAFVVVLVGVLAALLSDRQARPYWIGFALFGASYFWFAVFGEREIDLSRKWTIKRLRESVVIVEPYLATTGLLLLANSYVDRPPTGRSGVGWFVSIGHSVFTALVALAGGLLGRWVGSRFARDERSAAIPGEPLARG